MSQRSRISPPPLVTPSSPYTDSLKGDGLFSYVPLHDTFKLSDHEIDHPVYKLGVCVMDKKVSAHQISHAITRGSGYRNLNICMDWYALGQVYSNGANIIKISTRRVWDDFVWWWCDIESTYWRVAHMWCLNCLLIQRFSIDKGLLFDEFLRNSILMWNIF